MKTISKVSITKSRNIICIATLVVKEEKRKELLEILYNLVQNSPKEPGCLRYELHQDEENPNKFTFVDRFVDKSAFDYHCAQPYASVFDDLIPDLVETMEITVYKEIQLTKD